MALRRAIGFQPVLSVLEKEAVVKEM